MIRVYDMNSYLRVELETDVSGLAPRNFMQDVFACPDPVICVWDGPKGSQKRREIFPGYKVGRKAPDTGIYNGFHLTQKTLEHSKAVQIKVPGYEADDVIALLARRYAARGALVAIYSNDKDMWQLVGEFPKNVVCGANPLKGVEPKDTRLYKTWVGDSSDKIPGVPRFGESLWEENGPRRLQRATDMIFAGQDGWQKQIKLQPKMVSWLEENPDQFKAYWDIIGFLDVPEDLVTEHTIIGQPDFYKADQALKEFMQ
ncbi:MULTISPECIES: hypothetical protein [unclassified Mesorhizobium]|uniref:hypothetical protein n=1 Tax=unclassified Mesorhizobium TaxID=325217 RepID=UPI001127151B|nr:MULTISPECIES: hypothetical protein [unclassified Mesorhizobium]TPJ51632.1 hypothetical protein FJ426_20585 [Mesorhizobium sp. B2-6-4]TPN42310.1 hypothetical protein FJ979_01865 [Mesorhizobium sp. B1-1-6]